MLYVWRIKRRAFLGQNRRIWRKLPLASSNRRHPRLPSEGISDVKDIWYICVRALRPSKAIGKGLFSKHFIVLSGSFRREYRKDHVFGRSILCGERVSVRKIPQTGIDFWHDRLCLYIYIYLSMAFKLTFWVYGDTKIKQFIKCISLLPQTIPWPVWNVILRHILV